MAQTVVQISGHIIDSLILPKVLDLIISLGAEFEILDIQVGHRRSDRSHARIKVEASTPDLLDGVLRKLESMARCLSRWKRSRCNLKRRRSMVFFQSAFMRQPTWRPGCD